MNKKLRLRKARLSACRQIWYWRNEKEVRLLSFNTQKVPYSEHRAWFLKRINDPNSILLIAETPSQKSVGQVRIDRLNPRQGEIHFLIKKALRGQGWGNAMLNQACRYGFEKLNLEHILGQVFIRNKRSVRIFENLGFKVKGNRKFKTRIAKVMALSKKSFKNC